MSKKISFEGALARLEKIVQEMEAGDLALDAALKKFEEGMELSRLCSGMLEEAEKKVSLILSGQGKEPVLVPFEEARPSGEPEDGV